MATRVVLAKYDEDIFYVVPECDITRQGELRDCYFDSCGNKFGDYEAGDYSLNNSSSNAESDMKESGIKIFGEKFKDIEFEEDWNENDVFHITNAEETGFEGREEEIDKFMTNWQRENVYHTLTDSITYWDGHNTVTKLIDNDGFTDLVSVNGKISKQILAAYDRAAQSGKDLYVGRKYTVDFYPGESKFFFAKITINE